jgi:Asp-tRNA(Asn)/Glu-tRNA(Gln) amidotransferase B subunit
VTTAAEAAGKPSSALERYEAVIGIEIHCQLKTASKMFCGCSTEIDGAAPNSHCCPVCLGLPGVLPTINKAAVEWVIATGFAIEATVAETTRWDRKNYFYPDLPKGYQISQYQLPLASKGKLSFDTSTGPFTVRINRAHLEEDTGRLIHAELEGRRVSLIDFNRSGMPLMEIVTEPDIRTAEQARRYAEELRLLMKTIGASDAEMENGQMRVEANRAGGVRDSDRSQEHELDEGRGAGHRLRDRAPGGIDRRRWHDPYGDARLGRAEPVHVPHAAQGRRERLPLLPGARSSATPDLAGMARGDQGASP